MSRQLNVKMAVSQAEAYLWFCVEIKSILKTQGRMFLDNRIHTDSDRLVETSYRVLNSKISCCSEPFS